MRTADHQVAALQSALVGKGNKLLHRVLPDEIVGQGFRGGEAVEFLPVVVGVVVGELQDESRHGGCLIIRGVGRSVLGYEEVGRNAPAPVHHASDAGGIGVAGVFDAVLREELPVLVARQDVVLVVAVVAGHVGLLDAASGGRVVACDGEAYHRTVGERDGLLHQSLAEGAPPDDGAAVVVLDGTGEDFAGRGRAFVDEYHEGDVLVAAAPVAAELLAGRLASLHIGDEPSFGHELVGHLHGRLHVSARVAAQVDGEVLQSLLRELCQGDEQFGIGVLGKLPDADVARAVVEHIGGGHAL